MRTGMLALGVAAFGVALVACGNKDDGSSLPAVADAASPTEPPPTAQDAGKDAPEDRPVTPPAVPGDPANGAGVAVAVTINGLPRTFGDGQASWFKIERDGKTLLGFQTNATAASGWTLRLAAFDGTPGTYTCVSNPRGAGVAVFATDGAPVRYGGSVSSEACTVTVKTFGTRKGDRITGTFSAELDLTGGDAALKHLSLTKGTFDLPLADDVPPGP